jgi:hypothetical protein
MKSASTTVRGFGWAVAVAALVACIVMLNHRPSKHAAAPVITASHSLPTLDGAQLASDSSTGSTDPAAADAIPHARLRGNFINNTPRRRELGWAGLLEGEYGEGTAATDDSTDPEVVESQARAALNFVGADPDAGTAWARAINDAELSAETREELIEELDVAGLPADPQRLTQDHLPLILSRIEIVEQLAPSALDDTNAAAFRAVHRRLTSLAASLEGAVAAAAAELATPADPATPGTPGEPTAPGIPADPSAPAPQPAAPGPDVDPDEPQS